MVQMKVTAAALVAASAIAPAVASSYNFDGSLAARDYYDAEDFVARDYGYDLEERDLSDFEADLVQREPLFGFNHLRRWRNKKTLESQRHQLVEQLTPAPVEEREFDDEDIFTREFEEMFERDPFLGFGMLKKWWKGKKANKQMQQQQYASPQYGSSDPSSVEAREFNEDDLFTREFEEMFERDPFMGFGMLKKWWKGRKANKQAQQQPQYGSDPSSVEAREFDDEDIFTREFEEMFERDPFMGLGHLKKWWRNRKANQQQQQDMQSAPATPDYQSREFDEDLYTRDFEDDMEIEAREPEADYEEVLARYFDDLYERELAAAEDEIVAREFDDDSELLAREPGILDWFKNLFHPKKKADAAKAAAPAASAAPAAAPAADAAAPADAPAAETREWFDEIDELD